VEAGDISPADLGRFWAKVNKTSECWDWTAMTERGGYGRFRIHPDRAGRMALAHRVSYVIAHGALDDALELDHVCFNTRCVRPEHLRPVTAGENRQHRKGATVKSKSGVRGVRWYPRSKSWRAEVTLDSKKFHVGLFETIEDAEQAVIAKRNELFTHNNLDRVA